MSTRSVLLVIHAPSVPIVSERRLPSDVPLTEIKARLELLSGIPVNAQSLTLWSSRTDDPDTRAQCIKRLNDSTDERQSLEALGVQDGMGLRIEDERGIAERNQFGQEEEDRVEKFELNDEAYASRPDTVLAYKQRMKLGRFADTPAASSAAANGTSHDASDASVQLGARCQIEGARRGTIRFAGQTDFAAGIWIGVELDEPTGKNDGSVAGKRYFSCTAKHGVFVKPEKLVVGDFPIRSIEDEFMDDEDEEM